MEQQLRARIGAARVLLQRHQGSPNLTNLSRLQADAVREVIRQGSAQLSATFRAELAELLMTVPWAPSDGEAVISSLTPKGDPEIRTGRRCQQRFAPAFLSYFTEAQWVALSDASIDAYTKLDTILNHMGALGLRCPAEGTIKMLTTFWISVSHQLDELQVLSFSAKSAFLRVVKKTFDSSRRRLPDPVSYIAVLPASTIEYMRLHPQTFAAVFGTSSPVPSKVSLDRIVELDGTYACRSSATSIRAVQQQPLQLQLGQAGDIGALFAGLLNMTQRQLQPAEPLIRLTAHTKQPPMRRLPTVNFADSPQLALAPPQQPSSVLALQADSGSQTAHMETLQLVPINATNAGNQGQHDRTRSIGCAPPRSAAMPIADGKSPCSSNDGGCLISGHVLKSRLPLRMPACIAFDIVHMSA